jgi:hypothetical protein
VSTIITLCARGPVQMVFDPSNLRPVVACAAVLATLAAVFLVARLSRQDSDETKTVQYCRTGSFSSTLTLTRVPNDVRWMAAEGDGEAGGWGEGRGGLIGERVVGPGGQASVR